MKHYYNVKSYARTPEIRDLPSLIDIQLRSFDDFRYGGKLLELFDEINPIQSFNGKLSLYFPGNIPFAEEFELKYWFDEPKYDEAESLDRDVSFAAPLYADVALVNHEEGDEIIKNKIFLGDFPLMTKKGTFIINGTERVVVSQLIRSPGVYFDVEEERATGRQLSNAKLIPDRGAWMEFETRKTDYITIKFNRKRTIPVTILLRALAAVDDGLPASKSPIKTGEDEEILELFADVDDDATHKFIETSMKNEPPWEVKKKQTIAEVALIEFYKRMRPGDPPTLDNAREFLKGQLFDQRRYDLERVGRYKLNQRLELEGVIDPGHRTITKADIVALVRQMIIINNGRRGKDDIDHLGNRRVKTVGELIGNKLRIGMRRMERVVKERMSIREAEQLTPVALINIRPIVAAVREFFGSSQLSQFMEQTNPLTELTHKRTLSALGPGGLRRERAGFDVRDVHNSHYGRICPIETPEGPNIGLIGRLASYAQVNELGFIESPYRKVISELALNDPRIEGRKVGEDIEHKLVIKRGDVVDEAMYRQLKLHKIRKISVQENHVDPQPVSDALIGKTVAEGVEHSISVNQGNIVDDKLLARLKLHNVRKVSVLVTREEPYVDSQPVSDALIGKTVAEDVKHRLVVEKGAVIDDDKLWKLRQWGVQQVSVLDAVSQPVAEELIGKTLEEGVEHSISVNQGDVVDDDLLARLRLHNVRKVRVVVKREEDHAVSHEVSDALIGKTVAEDVEHSLKVKQGDVVDDKLLARLKLHNVRKVSVLVTRQEPYVDAQPVSDALIGKTVAEDVPHRLNVKKGAVIDDDMLWLLNLHKIEEISLLDSVNQDVSDPLIGKVKSTESMPVDETLLDRRLAKGIDKTSIIVGEGESIDEEVLNTLQLVDVDSVKVWERREVEVTESMPVDETLLDRRLAKGIDKTPVIVQADETVDEEFLNTLQLADKETVKVWERREVEVAESMSVDKALLGHQLAEGIDKASVIVHADETVDEDVLDTLHQHNVQQVIVLDAVSRDVSEALIGKTLAEDVEHSLDVKQGDVVDDDMLWKLRLHSIREISVLVTREENYVDSQDVSDALIGKTIAEVVKHRLVVEKGAVIDDDLLWQLKQHNVERIGLLDAVSQDVSAALIGRTLAEGVEHSISVNQGDVVDDKLLAQLKLHNVRNVSVLVTREENYVDPQPVSAALIGRTLAEGIKHSISVNQGDIVDDKLLAQLKLHNVRKVSVLVNREEDHTVSHEVSDALIGKTVAEDVKHRLVVEKGTVIDDDLLWQLKQHNVERIGLLDAVSQDVSAALIGRTLAEGIKHSISVNQSDVVDDKLLAQLKLHNVRKVSVVVNREEPYVDPQPVSDALIGKTVAEDVEHSLKVKQGDVVDDKLLARLKLHKIRKVSVLVNREENYAVSQAVSDVLIGKTIAEDVKHTLVVKKDADVDDDMLALLKLHNVERIRALVKREESYVDSQVVSDNLKGLALAENVEHRLSVKPGDVVDDDMRWLLRQHNVRKISALVKRDIEHTDIMPVSDDLIGSRLAANHEIDEHQRVIREKIRVARNRHDISDELYVDIAKGEEVPDSGNVQAFRAEIRPLRENLSKLNRAKEGAIVDTETVETLQLFEVKQVNIKYLKEVEVPERVSVNRELLGLRVDEEIEKSSVIVDAGKTIDARVVKKLGRAGVLTVKVWLTRTEQVEEMVTVSEAKPGMEAAEDIESQAVVVGAGEKIGAGDLDAMRWVDIDSVKVWDKRDVEVSESMSEDEALLGHRLAEGIDVTSVIVDADSSIDAEVLNALQLADKETVKVWERREVEIAESMSVDEALPGHQMAEGIEKSSVIVHAGEKIDAENLNALQLVDKETVKVWERREVEVSESATVDDDLWGKVVAEDIESDAVIVSAGQTIDEEDLEKLKRARVRKVKVKMLKTSQAAERLSVTRALLGRVVAEDIESEAVIVEEDDVLDAKTLQRLRQAKFTEAPVTPFATQDIVYLSADKEDAYTIAQANAPVDDFDQFVRNRVSARHKQTFVSVPPSRIDFMDIAPRQIVGISAALIPFLSHDAANRALMGSNMQRQAVPLLTPDVSVVSTGMEDRAARYSGQVLVSDIEAEVVSVQGHRVVARKADGEKRTFTLRKYERSNQSTCIDQHPLVRKGDIIKPDDVIADSSSTHDGHLALGQDVLTCFLSWDGGNYEDALLISEDMLRKDKFTSIHIEKHEIDARDTKLGAEEITYDIPNVGEEALKDLDENGIVRIGAEVGPNDILVGKITPKGEKELSPEEKLLRAIFGEQAREVKDSSLRLPHGERGKVIDVKIFTREEHPDLPAGVEKMVRVSVAQRRKLTIGDKMAGRHGNKGVISKIVDIQDMPYVEGGLPVEIILNPLGVPSRMNIGQILELHLGWAADRLGFRAITPVFDGVNELEIQAELGRAWMLDWAWKRITEQAWEAQGRLAEKAGIALEDFDDDIHVICAYLLDRVGEEAIILERDEVYARRVAVAEVLRELGYDNPDEIMVYDNEGLSDEVRDERDLAALCVSLRLWIEQTSPQEIALDDDLSKEELFDIANSVMFKTGQALPHYGKQTLYDGRTGEPFDHPVAVGYVHMLKLAHLVEDKAHARSTGPYSLVTQQPLGGKAQFGGQRFGEMEVWALEAYGAAHILQEMLTVKSDDVQGRVKTYESIVKGEPIEEPGIPTSFRVLVKELQSLGLAVEARTGNGGVIRFGKDDEQNRRPQPATGLLGLGSR